MARSRRAGTDAPTGAAASRADLASADWWLTAAVGALDDHLYFGMLHPDGRYEMLFAGPNLDRLLGGELPDGADEISALWRARIDPEDLPAYFACEADLLAGRSSQVDYRVRGLD